MAQIPDRDDTVRSLPQHARMTAPRHWFVIVNPAAGRGQGARYWTRLAADLAAAGVSAESVMTTAPGNGRALAAEAWRAGQRNFLALGGDGSLHDLVNGIADCGPEAIGSSTVGIAPCGTGNDWARGWRIPRRTAAVAAMVAAGVTREHDLGEIRFTAPADAAPVFFINVAGAGLDALASAYLPRGWPGALAYPWATLKALLSFSAPRFRVSAESIEWDGRQLVVFAAIGSHCGGGMHVAPGADPADGLADVIAIDALGLAGVLRRLPKLFDGGIRGDAAVHGALAKSLRVEADPPCAVEADGQVIGTTPIDVVVRPRAIRVLAPVPPSGSGP